MHSKPSQHTLASLRFVLTLLGVGFFVGFAGTANAALTSPAVVSAGTLVGTTNYDLGTTSVSKWNPTLPQGWHEEGQNNRRMVYVRPVTGGLEYMVAAYVNRNDCSGNQCRLEIRQSKDKGLTWTPISNALSPLLVDGGVETTKNFDYNLQVGPNGQDVWVAYVKEYVDVDVGDSVNSVIRTIPNAIIRKLTWSTSAATWTYGDERRATDGDISTEDQATTAFFVSGSSPEKVWSIVSYHKANVSPVLDIRQYDLVACSTDFTLCNDTANWKLERDNRAITVEDVLIGGRVFQPFAKFVLLQIGTSPMPGVIFSTPQYYTYNANHRSVTADGWVLSFRNTEGGGTTKFGLHMPMVWDSDHLPPGDGFSGTSGSVPHDFSVATYPLNDTTSNIVVTEVGGYAAGDTYDKTQTNSTVVNVRTGTITHTNLDFGVSSWIQLSGSGQTTFLSPSVGYVGDVPYIAARHATTNYLYTATAPWNNAVGHGDKSGKVKFAVATPERTAASYTLNSGLRPIMWAIDGTQRIVFSANVGGTTGAGSSSLLPVMGFGWASNFGWLSTNCASLPVNPCDAGLYGVGIGITAASASPPNLPIFSPSSTSTYPLGGYAWSSNAGFLSFERKDSAYNCGADPVCGDGDAATDDNDFGNPPGQAYHNSALVTDATAKYDRTNQHVYGWGRFLNLCNYQDIDGSGPGGFACFDKDAGWVRMRGYWIDEANEFVGNLAPTGLRIAPSPAVNCALFPENAVIEYSGSYAAVLGCTNLGATINLKAKFPNLSGGETSLTFHNVTGQDYGVDAFWAGNHYEFSGWAWSQEYGWIRFNPLIFIGYAWLESLFGNIYVGENFQLPDAQRLDGTQVKECDMDGDGLKDDPCFVSTYRIEAGGIIQALSYAPGQFVSSGTSASSTYLESLTDALGVCGFGTPHTDACSRLLGSFDNPASLLTRGPSNAFTFPTVQPSTSTYRNALGKLDVGGLTTSVTTAVSYPNVINEKKVSIGTNRFGHKLFLAEYKDGDPVDWSVGELFGNNFPAPCSVPPCPPAEWVWPLGKLQNQVVHVQGDLTVGYDPNAANKAETTFSSINREAETLDVASTANFPSAGTLIINTGGGNSEEYLSYTGKESATRFSGVKTVKGNPATVHSPGDSVRWVWRWPYVDTADTKLPQNLTIVVDGDLKINYNIIASDTTKDLDLLGSVLSSIGIKNAHSVAFIVRGDVVIAKEVNYITGAFIVISRDTTKDPDTSLEPRSSACDAGLPELFDGCGGLFDTGKDADPAFCSSTDNTCNPLTIEGLLFARQFNFARSGALETIDVPAERVIFDQRLFLNPPPGLEDLTKALPNPTRQIP